MKGPFQVIVALALPLLATGVAAEEGQNPTKAAATAAGMRLEWTHFIGGSGGEFLGWLRAPMLDRGGMLWFTGATTSRDFPTTPDALDRTYHGGSQQWGMEDAFLLKFNTRRPAIEYSTLLGGAKGPEMISDLCMDRGHNIYIVGNTGSSDFPTTGDALIRQFQGPDFRHADGFLTILGNGGRKLKYSTFIGGPQNDGAEQVFMDPSGELAIFGSAGSLDFLGADVVRPAGYEGTQGTFAMKLDANGSRIISSRLLGDFGNEHVHRLGSGGGLIVGNTTNPEVLTTAGAFNRTYHGGHESWGGDICVMRLSADLKTVSFATLFGGAGDESYPKIASVAGGDIFVAGETTSKDLPVTADALERTLEGDRAYFLARFSGDGRQLKYCTYLGGKGRGGASFGTASLVYDGRSRIYLASNTTSPDFPVTPDAAQPKHRGGLDVFLLAFNIADNSFAYGSYLGGSKGESFPGPRLVFDQQGSLYVLGTTDSDDFPTGARPAGVRKHTDIFISKFSRRQP